MEKRITKFPSPLLEDDELLELRLLSLELDVKRIVLDELDVEYDDGLDVDDDDDSEMDDDDGIDSELLDETTKGEQARVAALPSQKDGTPSHHTQPSISGCPSEAPLK